MEMGKAKEREKRGSGGATRAFRGVGFCSVVFLPAVLSARSMGRRSRALLLAGETRKAETRKEETALGACERREGNFDGRRRGFACERFPRDFVLTFARGLRAFDAASGFSNSN